MSTVSARARVYDLQRHWLFCRDSGGVITLAEVPGTLDP